MGSGTEQVEARQSGGANKPREGNRYNLKKKKQANKSRSWSAMANKQLRKVLVKDGRDG